MNIIIHAEVAGLEGVQFYEGDSGAAADAFVKSLDADNVTAIQCNMTHTNGAGEAVALARRAKGEDAPALLEDITAWLAEN